MCLNIIRVSQARLYAIIVMKLLMKFLAISFESRVDLVSISAVAHVMLPFIQNLGDRKEVHFRDFII